MHTCDIRHVFVLRVVGTMIVFALIVAYVRLFRLKVCCWCMLLRTVCMVMCC